MYWYFELFMQDNRVQKSLTCNFVNPSMQSCHFCSPHMQVGHSIFEHTKSALTQSCNNFDAVNFKCIIPLIVLQYLDIAPFRKITQNSINV